MNKEARVVVTWNCDRKCSYCCNNFDGVRESFKPLDDPEVLEKYDVIKLTGGEPTTNPRMLYNIMKWIPHTTKVYMYSNGFNVDEWIKFYERGGWGINYTPHDSIDFEAIKTVRSHGFPLRVRIQEGIYEKHIIEWLEELGCVVDVWKMNECGTVPEDRFDASETIF